MWFHLLPLNASTFQTKRVLSPPVSIGLCDWWKNICKIPTEYPGNIRLGTSRCVIFHGHKITCWRFNSLDAKIAAVITIAYPVARWSDCRFWFPWMLPSSYMIYIYIYMYIYRWFFHFCLWSFSSVAIPVCDNFVLWPFRSETVSVCGIPVCGRFGSWPFRFVTISVCGRSGLRPFRFVAI